jgi:hypothetical protein
VSARILREARAQQDELDAEDLQQTAAAAAGPAQIPAGAIAAALQQLHDSDSEGGEEFDGFTEAGSVWGGDDVSDLRSCRLLLSAIFCLLVVFVVSGLASEFRALTMSRGCFGVGPAPGSQPHRTAADTNARVVADACTVHSCVSHSQGGKGLAGSV